MGRQGQRRIPHLPPRRGARAGGDGGPADGWAAGAAAPAPAGCSGATGVCCHGERRAQEGRGVRGWRDCPLLSAHVHAASLPACLPARPPARPPAPPPAHPPTHLATIWGDAGDHVGCAPANCGALVVVRPQGNALCREGHAAQGQVTRQDEKTVRRTGLAGQGTAPALGRALHSLLPAASQISPQPATPAATLPSPSPHAAVLIPTHRCVPDPPGC